MISILARINVKGNQSKDRSVIDLTAVFTALRASWEGGGLISKFTRWN